MRSPEISILKTVAYFDVFSYPITSEEIIFFLDKSADSETIIPVLERLVKTKQLFKFDNFYSIRNDVRLVDRRIKGNYLAEHHIKKAKRVARLLYWLPYVRGIAISGSLSKNYADENSDLDFFIITAANRLWIVRIFYSILYKIVSVLRIKEWFCLNYFIDELDLEVEEHNVFTAVEVSTLMPLKGKMVFEKFFEANSWVFQYQPNYKPAYQYLSDSFPALIKHMTEWSLNFQYGNNLDSRIQQFFKRRFERQTVENKQSEKGLTIGAYKADKHACKPLPQFFQPKILSRYNERVKSVEEKYHQSLNKEALLLNA